MSNENISIILHPDNDQYKIMIIEGVAKNLKLELPIVNGNSDIDAITKNIKKEYPEVHEQMNKHLDNFYKNKILNEGEKKLQKLINEAII